VPAGLGNGQTTSATITREAAEDLDLVEGDQVLMISKTTETYCLMQPLPTDCATTRPCPRAGTTKYGLSWPRATGAMSDAVTSGATR